MWTSEHWKERKLFKNTQESESAPFTREQQHNPRQKRARFNLNNNPYLCLEALQASSFRFEERKARTVLSCPWAK
jgi:hypothetical protein